MNSQQKKEYLKGYANLTGSINQKLEEYQKLKSLCEKVTTTLSWTPKGGSSKKEDCMIRLAMLGEEIDQEINECVVKRGEIQSHINTVVDDCLRTLLSYRYINGDTFEQIAVNMGYSYKQICRKHGRALENMSLNVL